MQISENFTRKEFACKCGCGQNTVDAVLVKVLQGLRDAYGLPVTITSGNRCETHNRATGGSRGSQHLRGKAADITVKNVPAREVFDWLRRKYPNDLGLGSYSNWTHVDVRDGCARWVV